MVESEYEDCSDEEVDMKSMMKTLALITIDYNRGFRRPFYRCQFEREDRGRSYEKRTEEKREEKEDRRDENRSHQRSDGRGGEINESKGDKSEGCFKFGKPGHFASDCNSKDSRPKQQKGVVYYKKKAAYYTQRSLLAEKDDLQTDESSANEANNPSFCGMANIDSIESDQGVSTYFHYDKFYKEYNSSFEIHKKKKYFK